MISHVRQHEYHGGVYTADDPNMGSSIEENRRACVFRLCRLADVCRELNGAELIIGAVRSRTSDAATQEIYHRQFEKSLGWKQEPHV